MSKVPLHTVDEEPFDHEDDMWPDADWDDYLSATHDWSNWDEHPWEWFHLLLIFQYRVACLIRHFRSVAY